MPYVPLWSAFGLAVLMALASIPLYFGFLRVIERRWSPAAPPDILTKLANLAFLPVVAGALMILAAGRPPASSLLAQRITVGPVVRTTATALSTQGDQYYGQLNTVGCDYHNVSVLKTAPAGSYVVVDKRSVREWLFYPFITTGPMTAECTASFHR